MAENKIDIAKEIEEEVEEEISENSSWFEPMAEIAGFPVGQGSLNVTELRPSIMGSALRSIPISAQAVSFCFFTERREEPYAVIPFPKEYKIGDVYSMIVFGLNVEEFEYAYRIDGPKDPSRGLLFDKRNVLLDPYAKAVTGQHIWGESNPGCYHARVVKDTFDWEDMPQSSREISDLIIYELHVRGFTKDPSSGTAHGGTFRGLQEKIPYLRELGINAVELMPVFEFDEMAEKEK